MIEVDPAAHIGIWGYVGLKGYIATLFDGPVDVVNRNSLDTVNLLDGGRDLARSERRARGYASAATAPSTWRLTGLWD